MTISRILSTAGFLLGLATAAQAQTAPGATSKVIMPGSEHGSTMAPVMDNSLYFHALLDQFEGRVGGGQDGFKWEGQAWAGTDYDKVWLKSEGFALGKGGVEDGRHELLYDRALTTYLDLQAGVRTDWDSSTGRSWAALGVQGLAPLFFDYEATTYLSDSGHAALRLAASYDLLITQRLILQPEIEMNFYSKADPGRAVGAGLSDIDAGLRLRYEISRKFAPYVGVAYSGKFGQTADFARKEGDAATAVQFVFGIRTWF
ncbi:MAG: copper resistance protein B [Rhodospirillales bacterium]|jgi:copper resistance protein B|nr:copper resistance protein B [Rhodospirillales bacterium]